MPRFSEKSSKNFGDSVPADNSGANNSASSGAGYATMPTEQKPWPRYPRRPWRWVWRIVLIVLIVWAINSIWNQNTFPAVDPNKLQAVFLSNNQVYFGHLANYSRDYITLTDIFYLRPADSLQQNTATQSSLNLIKLGSELHGPEDMMYVPKAQVLFWENLKPDSQVAQAINGFAAKK